MSSDRSFYVNKNKAILLMVIASISIFALMIDSVFVLCWFAIAQLVFGIWLIRESENSLFSYPVVFIIFVFLFHIFRIFYAYLSQDSSLMIVFWYRTPEDILPAIKYYIVTMFFILCGIAFYKEREASIKDANISDKTIFLIGIILFAVGIVPKVMINYEQLAISQLGNYLDTYQVNLSGRGTIATLVYPGSFMILLAKRKNTLFSRVLIIIISIYEVIMMLSGNRIMALSFLLTLYLLYFLYVEKIKKRRVFLYTIALFVLLSFLNIIREYRAVGIPIDQLWQLILEEIKHNPLIDMMCELGSTMNTLILSMKYIPSTASYGYGMSYIMFVPNLIPRLDLGALNDHLIFVYKFPVFEALGGDFIGEFYYNFSYLGVFCGYIIGRLVAKFSNSLKSYEINPLSTSVVLPIVFYSFSYIRGYFYGFRVAVYHIVIIIVMMKIITHIKSK